MNLLEWIKKSLESYFLIKNILIASGSICIFISWLLIMKFKKRNIISILLFLIMGIIPIYASGLMEMKDIIKEYNNHPEIFDKKTDNLKEILKEVKTKLLEFQNIQIESREKIRKIVKKQKISFSEEQIDYVAKGYATEKLNIPMIESYVISEEKRFGKKTANKLFPKLGIKRQKEIFDIDE